MDFDCPPVVEVCLFLFEVVQPAPFPKKEGATSKMTLYVSVFQPGFRGTQRFHQFLSGFPENAKNIVLYVTFRFRQVIRNFQDVPRIEKG